MQNGSNIAPNTQADDNSSTNDVFMVLSGNMEWMAIPGADAQLEEGFRMAVHELIRIFRTLGIHIRRQEQLRAMMENGAEKTDMLASLEDDIVHTRYVIDRLLRGMSAGASAEDVGRFARNLRESALEISDADGDVLI